MPQKYEAVRGFQYLDGRKPVRVEKGDVVDEPAPAILRSWLLNNVVKEVGPRAVRPKPVRAVEKGEVA
jgi:hypothetical protein